MSEYGQSDDEDDNNNNNNNNSSSDYFASNVTSLTGSIEISPKMTKKKHETFKKKASHKRGVSIMFKTVFEMDANSPNNSPPSTPNVQPIQKTFSESSIIISSTTPAKTLENSSRHRSITEWVYSENPTSKIKLENNLKFITPAGTKKQRK